MTTVIVTGSVGSGKTTISKELAKKLKYKYVDVNLVIEKNKLCEDYDKERDCQIIDEQKLAKVLEKMCKKGNYVIDSHMAHYVQPKAVDVCIVTKCEIKVIQERLKLRKYSDEKIKENLEAEIFDTCFIEAHDIGHKVLIIDTTNGFKIEPIVEYILKRKRNY